MQTENSIGDNSSHWKVVKGISEVLPDVGVSVLSETLIVKPIDLGDLATFVVSPQNSDAISVPNLQGYKKCDCFKRVVTSVNVITHEQIIRFRALSSNAEQLCKIIKLSMDISTDSYWSNDGLYVGFVLQDFLSLRAT